MLNELRRKSKADFSQGELKTSKKMWVRKDCLNKSKGVHVEVARREEVPVTENISTTTPEVK